MNIVLFGPPGAGKGTQGEILMKKLGISTVSTGVMLRTAIKEGTTLGTIAAEYINDGKLVPDKVMVGLVKERLSQPDLKDGFILDGFPRTVAQAEALCGSGIHIDKVLSIEVDDDEIIKRLSSRRECQACGTPYSTLYKIPKTEGKCDNCGGELIQRKDDNPETIKHRLDVFHTQTEPIKDFYNKLGLLVTAKGEEEISDTTKNVFSALRIEG